ncbi:uncharacterized protein IL334_004440 [Kwoniella shivajii]|uniref:Velvet domain-containing protein n=1 Tax=Kwoniella shivajii TaxID=564305 RepID=A0ABZ1D0X2_9TREE|nr:hypothetical protein IL334_004440 [Kwoniella shivajii]
MHRPLSQNPSRRYSSPSLSSRSYLRSGTNNNNNTATSPNEETNTNPRPNPDPTPSISLQEINPMRGVGDLKRGRQSTLPTGKGNSNPRKSAKNQTNSEPPVGGNQGTPRVVHPPPTSYNFPAHVYGSHYVTLPPPPAENHRETGIDLSGFQTDYLRRRLDEQLRRAPHSDIIRSTSQVDEDEKNKPVPSEAYIILRFHRKLNGGWKDETDKDLVESARWTYELNLVQQPTRGKAVGLGALPRGWPALSAPLIVQLIVKDQVGTVISVDHPSLSRRLVHTSVAVDLVSPDGGESRSHMRVFDVLEDGQHTAIKDSPDESDKISRFSDMCSRPERVLLGCLHRSANTYVIDGKRGIYFLFTEIFVRNVGTFALKISLLDLAGPAHVGTSIGITGPITSVLTDPFFVHHASEFPGALPVTDLSRAFIMQGERNLGRRTRAENNGISSEDDLNRIQSLSPENQITDQMQKHAAEAQAQNQAHTGSYPGQAILGSQTQGPGQGQSSRQL